MKAEYGRRHSCADCKHYHDAYCEAWHNKAVEWDKCGKWERRWKAKHEDDLEAVKAEIRDTEEGETS